LEEKTNSSVFFFVWGHRGNTEKRLDVDGCSRLIHIRHERHYGHSAVHACADMEVVGVELGHLIFTQG